MLAQLGFRIRHRATSRADSKSHHTPIPHEAQATKGTKNGTVQMKSKTLLIFVFFCGYSLLARSTLTWPATPPAGLIHLL